MRLFLLSLLTTLLLTACKQNSVHNMVPAILADSRLAALEEIQTFIAEALGGEVLLSDDAFTANSQLVVERQAHRDAQGNRLPGRIMSEPERFRLGLHNNDCVLLHLNSGRHWTLQEARCTPALGDAR